MRPHWLLGLSTTKTDRRSRSSEIEVSTTTAMKPQTLEFAPADEASKHITLIERPELVGVGDSV